MLCERVHTSPNQSYHKDGPVCSPQKNQVQMKSTLSEIKASVDQLAERIGAPQDALPTYGYSEHTARPHVEVDTKGYHFIIVERKEELERHTTPDLDELLYQVFTNVTFAISGKYEHAHRMENHDPRKIIFKMQVELLTRLSSKWAERESQVHKQLLNQHPFDDYASARATLNKDLREHSHSSEAAWIMACAKYPLPKSARD